MKTILFLTALLATAIPAAAQNQTRDRRVTVDSLPPTVEKSARNRVVTDQRDANHVRQPMSSAAGTDTSKKVGPFWGDTAIPIQENTMTPARSAVSNSNANNSSAQPNFIKPTALVVDRPATTSAVPVVANNSSSNSATIYRVGIGDVLDIRLSNLPTRESTLFTVLKNGAIEYPFLEKPLSVSGMTVDEIAQRINQQIKVIRNARTSVSVRDYASHSAVVTGSVDNPGRKILRREAMPLYTVLSEALPRAEATTATITRNGREIAVTLSNTEQMATLILPGDLIKVTNSTRQFVYVIGDVQSAGEKDLRAGMTLTQALMAAGGVSRDVQIARIARRDAAGLLNIQEFNLMKINDGKSPDPLLQPGDRIEVRRGVW